MKTLPDIGSIEGAKVLVRVDFNVPIKNGLVTDDLRIRLALPTIEYLHSRGAKVVLISHIESIDGFEPSIAPVADCLNKLGTAVGFVKRFGDAYAEIEKMNNGQCLLLENLRLQKGEKENDKKFAKELASLADIYVNEAFSVSHREHASIVGVPQFLEHYPGLQFAKEISGLSQVFHPEHPFLVILGGAKFDTKLPLIEKLSDSADTVFVGGALANDLFKQKGYEVGTSSISVNGSGIVSELVENPRISLPCDVVNEQGLVKKAYSLAVSDKIVDAGPETLVELKNKIDKAKFILWNGPLGIFEHGYKQPTLELARMIATATTRGAHSIVGGGDTLAAIEELNIFDKFSFVSTGGGAMLEFLAKGTLPGIEALSRK